MLTANPSKSYSVMGKYSQLKGKVALPLCALFQVKWKHCKWNWISLPNFVQGSIALAKTDVINQGIDRAPLGLSCGWHWDFWILLAAMWVGTWIGIA